MTTIPLSKETKKRLKEYGKFQESWDDLLNRLLDKIEKIEEEENA